MESTEQIQLTKAEQLARIRQKIVASNAWQHIHKVYQIMRAAFVKFLDDDCLIRAGAIAYSIVFSIIPLLAVLVRYADVDKEVIRANLARLMAAYGMSDATEILIIINEIIDRANAIAGVGAIIMIFSATNVISHLENAFNYIYRASVSRPYLYRFSIYISSLVILPGLMLLSSGVFRTLMNTLKPPAFKDMALSDNKIWIASSDGILRVQDKFQKNKRIKRVYLADKINQKASFRNIYLDMLTLEAGYFWQIMGKGESQEKLGTGDFNSMKRIVASDDRLYVLSKSGALFFSKDLGKTWDYRLFRFKSNPKRAPFMEDIRPLPDGRVMILATAGSRSFILMQNRSDSNGQGVKAIREWSLIRLGSVYNHIFEYAPPPETRKRPRRRLRKKGPERFSRPGFYLAGNGHYLFSADQGRTWTGPHEALYSNRRIKINTMFFDRQGDITLAGANAALWKIGNKNRIFSNLRAQGREDILDFYIKNEGTGFLHGKNALFRFTPDGGKTWLGTNQQIFKEIVFFSHLVLDDGSILFAGERETLVRVAWPVVTDKRDAKGHRLVHLKQISLHTFPFLKSVVLQIMLAFIFYFLVFAVFVLGYYYLPNSNVEWKPAIIGGAVTSAALLIFALIFQIWIVSFASTGYIYGVWALIPVGMLIVLTSTQIILFGLELAYVIQHPYLYQLNRRVKAEHPEDYLFWNSALLVTLIYHKMYQENRPLNNERALPYFNNDLRALQFTRERLLGKKIFAYETSSEEYFPVRPPGELSLKEIQQVVLQAALEIPPHTRANAYRNKLSGIQKEIFVRLEEGTGDITIKDLLPLLGKLKKT